MTLNSVVIRGVAACTLFSGVTLFAMQSGFLGGAAEAHAEFIPNTPVPGEFIANTRPPGQLTLTGGSGTGVLLDIAYTRPPSLGVPADPRTPQAAEVAEGPRAPDLSPASPRLASGQVEPDVAGTLPQAAAPAVTAPRPDAMIAQLGLTEEAIAAANVALPETSTPFVAAPQPAALIVPTSLDDAAIAVPEAQPAPAPDAGVSAFGLPCDITVTATAMPAAMVALDVMAPCRPDATVTIMHSGLGFDAQLDAYGLMTLDVPAFETPAFFTVRFADGREETTLAGVADLGAYDRIGVTWEGNAMLELHALEFGASHGEPGHVWHRAPSSTDAAVAGTGGFLSLLGTTATFAQIYTLPRAAMDDGQGVELGIDVPVTAESCTADITAQTLRAEGGRPVESRELSFTMPSCDAVGDYLVLQNPLDDLRLAASN